MICHDFRFWCQKVLPLVYDESLSYYEVLCKLMDFIGKMFDSQEDYTKILEELKQKQEILESEFNELLDNFDKLKNDVLQTIEDIKNGKYLEIYLDALKDYIDENLQNLVKGIVSYVSFGLTADGHFCAYIPPTWDFIEFSTIDYGEVLEGHLVLKW